VCAIYNAAKKERKRREKEKRVKGERKREIYVSPSLCASPSLLSSSPLLSLSLPLCPFFSVYVEL
jgi:hypothetical protein